ncbi:hypothetical protein GCM10010342_39860 [Streptomyces anulatus]|nr:hypothetical protein GCM10010342_39860 [Streptomyces anulatus]
MTRSRLGDKGYSSKAIRARLRRRGIPHTIPERADQIANRARRESRGGRPPSTTYLWQPCGGTDAARMYARFLPNTPPASAAWQQRVSEVADGAPGATGGDVTREPHTHTRRAVAAHDPPFTRSGLQARRTSQR